MCLLRRQSIPTRMEYLERFVTRGRHLERFLSRYIRYWWREIDWNWRVLLDDQAIWRELIPTICGARFCGRMNVGSKDWKPSPNSLGLATATPRRFGDNSYRAGREKDHYRRVMDRSAE